jgi:ketosteroid isomerase-like protein
MPASLAGVHTQFSALDVMANGDLAVLRYRSIITISVNQQEAGTLNCWHLDCYHRDLGDGGWRIRWSRATSIE